MVGVNACTSTANLSPNINTGNLGQPWVFNSYSARAKHKPIPETIRGKIAYCSVVAQFLRSKKGNTSLNSGRPPGSLFSGDFATTPRQPRYPPSISLFSGVPSPSSGGSIVLVCLMSLQRDVLLKVQTHSSSRVRGCAGK